MKITAIDIIIMCFIFSLVEYLSNKTFEYIKRKIELRRERKKNCEHIKKFLNDWNKYGSR